MNNAGATESKRTTRSLGFFQRCKASLEPGTVFRENEPLARMTTLGVGGAARYYAEPSSVGDLRSLLKEARCDGIRVLLLGRGSNVVVPDEGVNALVLRLRHPSWCDVVALGDGRLRAGAGVRLRKLCGVACNLGLGGLEFLEGIPGTVGGALRMNAGAMGGWVFDIVDEVVMMTLDGEERMIPKGELHYGYRTCRELMDAIALGAVIAAPRRENGDSIRRRLLEFQRKRTGAQPKDSSAGCIFKNPDGDYAGRIIDELGLKGKRVGDAEVSMVHGNFIVNRGRATAADVIELVRELRDEIRRRKGTSMEPEVLLFGGEWNDLL